MASSKKIKVETPLSKRIFRFSKFFFSTKDRYILKLYLFSYFVCATSFVGIYISADIMSRLKKFTHSQFPFLRAIFEHYSAMLPVYFTYYFGPLLTLSAAMFTLTLLNKRNEILPLKVAGLSLYRIIAPILAIGFFFSILTFLSQEILIPSIKDNIRQAYGISHNKSSRQCEVLVDSQGTEFKITRYWPIQKRGDGVIVTVFTRSENGRTIMSKQYIADYIKWEKTPMTKSGGQWVLLSEDSISKDSGVREFQFDKNGDKLPFNSNSEKKLYYQEFSRVPLKTDLVPEDFDVAGGMFTQSLSLKDLSRQWKRRHDNKLLVKIYQHWTFPFTHIILLLIGLPFVLNQHNRNVFLGVIVSIGICVIYYLVNGMCMELGTRGVIQPLVSAILPLLLFGGLGTVLLDNLRT